MAGSKVAIANSALIKIGATPILSLDDDTKEGRTCKARYDEVRRIVLRLHPWNCAIKRVILSPLSTDPVFGFTNQFELPADCLRVLYPNVDSDPEYRVEGRTIQIDSSEIQLKYVYDLEDTSKMDVLLAEAISTYLAFDIAYAITQKDSVRDAMFGLWRNIESKAKTIDAQEDSRSVLEADTWVEERFYDGIDRSGR